MIDKVTEIFWENLLNLFPMLAQDSWGRLTLAVTALTFVSGLSWAGVKIWQRSKELLKNKPKAEFFDLPRLGHSADTYAYSARNTVFLGREYEFQKLEKFAHEQRIFCWWLICGSGGIGKSRLALEFSLHLNAAGKKWDTGFIQLEKVDIAELQEWQPQRPTFLILDYVAKNIISSPPKEDGNGETKVSLLIKLFSRRAIDKKLQHPVRILLLERDYRIQITNSDYLMQEWYRSIAETLTSDGAISAGFEFEKPLLIEPLSEENLCILAADIYQEKHGISPFPKSLFLERFKKIDADKKRTLFVIYLAADMAREQGGTNLSGDGTREAILQRLIDREFDVRWNKIIKSEAELGYVVDATIRNGYLPPIPRLSHQERKNWLKLGCSTLTSAGFKFLPLEPDILGEYLILSGHAGDIFLPYTARKEIARKAFEEIKDDAALFFMRCMLDYPQNDVWLNLFLDVRPDDVELREKWMSYAIAMLWYLGHKDYFESAYKIMEHILREDDSLVCRMAKAFAVSSIMGLLTEREGHSAALKYYRYFDELGEENYIQDMKANAIRILIEYHASTFDFENASKYLNSLRKFTQSDEVQRIIAISSSYVIHSTCKKAEIDGYTEKDVEYIEDIYRKLDSLSNSPKILDLKMRAASNAIYSLRDIDPIKTCNILVEIIPNCLRFAQRTEFRELLATVLLNITGSRILPDDLMNGLVGFYKSLAAIKKENVKNREILASVAQNYIIRYCAKGYIDKAENILEVFSMLGNSIGVRNINAAALIAFHQYHTEAKDIKKSLGVVSSIRNLGAEYEIQIRLANVLSQTMAAFDESTSFELLKEWYDEIILIFRSFFDVRQQQEILCNSLALANMVLSIKYAKCGNILLSKGYYEKMKELPSLPQIRNCIAHTAKVIGYEFVERDAFDDIVSLYSDSASFGEEDDILMTRIILCMGMAAKCEKDGNHSGVYHFFNEAHSLTQNNPELLKLNALNAALIIYRYMNDGDYKKAILIFDRYKNADCDEKTKELFVQLEGEFGNTLNGESPSNI